VLLEERQHTIIEQIAAVMGILRSDDLLFGRHGVLQCAEAGRFATPTAPRPPRLAIRRGQDTFARLGLASVMGPVRSSPPRDHHVGGLAASVRGRPVGR
jgi:hypothetical protein